MPPNVSLPGFTLPNKLKKTFRLKNLPSDRAKNLGRGENAGEREFDNPEFSDPLVRSLPRPSPLRLERNALESVPLRLEQPLRPPCVTLF
jgi:hypothetical protein